MAERRTIRISLPGETVDEFTRAATEHLRGEFFVPIDRPIGSSVSIEARFADAVALRGEARVRAAVRGQTRGLLLHIVKLAANSLPIPLLAPDSAALPAPDHPITTTAVELAATLVEPSTRVPTRHVVRRVATAPAAELDEPPETEFADVPTPTSARSAELASALQAHDAAPFANRTRNEKPTVPAPLASVPKPSIPDAALSDDQALEAAFQPFLEPLAHDPLPANRTPAPPPAAAIPVTPSRPGAQAPAHETPPLHTSAVEPVPARRSRTLIAVLGAIGVTALVVVAVVLRSNSVSPPHSPLPQAPSALAIEVERHLRTAATRLDEGKLVGPGGDTALDHLLLAKQLAPDHPEVVRSLASLATTFEQLGDGALASGDYAEAAAHLQAALTAGPARSSVAEKLRDAEAHARELQAKPK